MVTETANNYFAYIPLQIGIVRIFPPVQTTGTQTSILIIAYIPLQIENVRTSLCFENDFRYISRTIFTMFRERSSLYSKNDLVYIPRTTLLCFRNEKPGSGSTKTGFLFFHYSFLLFILRACYSLKNHHSAGPLRSITIILLPARDTFHIFRSHLPVPSDRTARHDLRLSV